MIGIIAAEEKEMQAIKDLMQNIIEEQKYDLEFLIGNIHQKEVVLVKCG